MNSVLLASAILIPHPTTVHSAVAGIAVHVRSISPRSLGFHFVLDADLARLRVPPPCPPKRTDGLWHHTCFEAFVARADAPAYHEFNFAPSGEWAAYAFDGYREGAPLPAADDPVINAQCTDQRLELDAIVPLTWLDATRSGARLRLALAAVIEDRAGALTYWALAHPLGRPDFHHPAAFVLPLELPPDDLAAAAAVA